MGRERSRHRGIAAGCMLAMATSANADDWSSVGYAIVGAYVWMLALAVLTVLIVVRTVRAGKERWKYLAGALTAAFAAFAVTMGMFVVIDPWLTRLRLPGTDFFLILVPVLTTYGAEIAWRRWLHGSTADSRAVLSNRLSQGFGIAGVVLVASALVFGIQHFVRA